MANRKLSTEDKKKYHLKSLFGLSVDDYNKMLVKQNYRCATCKQQETRIAYKTGKVRYLSVDHCHKTGKIRGLLCDQCNRTLGLLRDDIETLKNMVAYLRKAERAKQKTDMAM